MENQEKGKNWAIILFCIGILMAALDSGIISAALTTINKSFDVSANWGAWGVTIYTLGLAISIPIVGKLSDRYGRKKLFIFEIALFGLGSLLVALSPNFTFYLIARFIQAIGGGGIFIIGSSHVLSTLPEEKQGKALGILGAMNGIGAILGPNLGSIILDLTNNWHYLFLINVPIAIALVILGYFKIQETKEATVGKLDLIGTILLSLAVLSVMYGLTNIDGTSLLDSLTNANVYVFLLIGLILFAGLLFYEKGLDRRQGDPILPIKLLAKPVYLLTLLIGALSGALLAAMIYIPAFTEQVLGISAENSGYWMTPLALASGIGAGFGGALVDKRGPVLTAFISGLITMVGFLLFPGWIELKWQFIIASCVAGLGMGILLGAPLNILATEKLQKDKGSALAGLSLARQIGMTIAPTIYAGFIVRGFNKVPQIFEDDFPNILKSNISSANLDNDALLEFEQLATIMNSTTNNMTEKDFSNIIGQIQSPELKNVIQQSLDQITLSAAQDGYGGLFTAAAILAILIIVFALIIQPIRKKANSTL